MGIYQEFSEQMPPLLRKAHELGLIVPADVKVAMRDADDPARVLHFHVTTDLLRHVLQKGLRLNEQMLCPGGDQTVPLGVYLEQGQYLELARDIQDYRHRVDTTSELRAATNAQHEQY